MARIQILELPATGRGDSVETPFALVIDQADDSIRAAFDRNADVETRSLPDGTMYSLQRPLAEQLGARTVLVFDGAIEIPASGVDLPDAVLVGGGNDALTEMARSRDEWMERSIRFEGRVAQIREQREQHKTAITDALGIDRIRDWDDVLNAARGIRRERQAQRDIIQAAYRLHCPDSYQGQEICTHCSAIDDTGTRYVLYPCATIKLTAPPEPETRPETPEPTP
jgi:hypothetical protein